jgi:Phytanoyl-CoA dioxygenase (PhyH)
MIVIKRSMLVVGRNRKNVALTFLLVVTTLIGLSSFIAQRAISGDNTRPPSPSPLVFDQLKAAAFRRDGFLVLRNLLNAEQIESLQESVRDVFNATSSKQLVLKGGTFVLRYNVWTYSSQLRQELRILPWGHVAGALFGSGESVRLLENNAYKLKEGGAGFKTHLDTIAAHCIDPVSYPHFISMWIPYRALGAASGGGIAVANASKVDSRCLGAWNTHLKAVVESPGLEGCSDQIESAMEMLEFAPGDVLAFRTFASYHRSVPFVVSQQARDAGQDVDAGVVERHAYVIRMMSSEAKWSDDPRCTDFLKDRFQDLPQSFRERCQHRVQSKLRQGGDPDTARQIDSYCFPQIFPQTLPEEQDELAQFDLEFN